MTNTDFKVFIFKNNVKQSYIADYVGVSDAFISQVASGARSMPDEMLSKLINNDKGWDVSMFGVEVKQEPNAQSVDAELDKLRDMYSELLRERDDKIRSLELEICRLRMKLSNK